jgi:FKBP-type peptidyl-prolyl cis-trans isomerase
MRTLAALLLLLPCTLAQDPAPAPAPEPGPPQLTTPDPLPGAPLPEGAEWKTTASGLRYVVLVPGDEKGTSPGPTDRVTVNYSGWFEDGRLLDASKPRAPAKFALNQVIKGWTEALQMMHPGSKYKLHVPWQLGYGEKGRGITVPPRTNIVFDVELVAVAPPPPAPPTPPSFAIPDDKELVTTESGLKSVQIRPGNPEGRKPGPSDTVTVWYSGWLMDGTPFDSAYERRQPSTFALTQVIKGWTEGLQLMQEGEVRKFVVPAGLAYGEKGRSGIPPGATLLFQVELIKVGH